MVRGPDRPGGRGGGRARGTGRGRALRDRAARRCCWPVRPATGGARRRGRTRRARGEPRSASGRCSRRWTRVPASSRATPYHYPTYGRRTRSAWPSARGGDPPGRTGSGRGSSSTTRKVHAAYALAEAGTRPMVNSNPETVSTDYDTSARPVLEPLSAEDVLAVREAWSGRWGPLPDGRPDAAAPRPRSRGGGVDGARHAAGRDRPRRGSRPIRPSSRSSRTSPRRTARLTALNRARTALELIGYPVVVRPPTCSAAAR